MSLPYEVDYDRPFPLKTHLKKDRILNSFKKLRELPLKSNNSLAGNPTTDYFFYKHRIKTHSRGWTHEGAWNNKKQRELIYKLAWKIRVSKRESKEFKGTDLRSAMDLSYNSVSQFKPSFARKIYQRFKPTHILDFCAGWGGRCLGAMSLDINYTGIDSNTNLKEAYDKMTDFLKTHHNSNIKIIFDKSENVDFSKIPKYDLVFTSPPYELLEKYECMEKYTKQTFYTDFLYPVIVRAYKYLSNNGWFCLNMSKDMYSKMVEHLGKCDIKIKMTLNRRTGIGKGESFEYIYCWNKNGMETEEHILDLCDN